MSYTTPEYEIIVPSPTTQVKDLGAELMAMGIRLEEVLSNFDYNGADPSLVLSRVAALENKTTKVLATLGGSAMTAVQTVNLSEAISAQRNGVILIWSYYSGGAAANSHYNHTPVHKYQLALPGSGQVTLMLDSSGTGPVKKFIYVTDTQLAGHDNNALVGGIGMVLRAVVGF